MIAQIRQIIAIAAMFAGLIWFVAGQFSALEMQIFELRRDLETMTMDRFRRAEAVIWATEMQAANPEMKVPDIPRLFNGHMRGEER